MSIKNEGIGGTTSQQWAAGDTMDNALGQAPEATKVIYTIGGNDFMGGGDATYPGKCQMDRAKVKEVVTLSLQMLVNKVVAAGKTASAITMMG